MPSSLVTSLDIPSTTWTTATEHLNNYIEGEGCWTWGQTRWTVRHSFNRKHQQIAPHLLLQMQSHRQIKEYRIKCCTVPSHSRQRMPLAEPKARWPLLPTGIQELRTMSCLIWTVFWCSITSSLLWTNLNPHLKSIWNCAHVFIDVWRLLYCNGKCNFQNAPFNEAHRRCPKYESLFIRTCIDSFSTFRENMSMRLSWSKTEETEKVH